MNARENALRVAQLAFDKKGFDIVILDVGKVIDYADFLVIVTGASQPQVQTIADYVAFEMKKAGSPAVHVEGLRDGRWVLVDFGDIFVHVFQPKVRQYYEIERLWGMAPKVATGLPETPAHREEELPEAPFLIPDDRAAR